MPKRHPPTRGARLARGTPDPCLELGDVVQYLENILMQPEVNLTEEARVWYCEPLTLAQALLICGPASPCLRQRRRAASDF